MEVACGEYGDVVPQLVVALKSRRLAPLKNTSETKVINPEKAVREKNSVDAKYVLQDGLVMDDKIASYDANLQCFLEMKDSKLLEGYADTDSEASDSLKNEKLYDENGLCIKQVSDTYL
jgi:hypothetical protein